MPVSDYFDTEFAEYCRCRHDELLPRKQSFVLSWRIHQNLTGKIEYYHIQRICTFDKLKNF